MLHILGIFVCLFIPIFCTPLYKSPLCSLPNEKVNETINAIITKRQTVEYGWETGDWNRCSKCCGGGIQYRQVKCIYYPDTKWLAGDKWCENSLTKKPLASQPCNEKPCTEVIPQRKKRNRFLIRWEMSSWNDCSNICGGGIQKREVTCVMDIWGVSIPIKEVFCEDITQMRPQLERSCNENVCLPDKVGKKRFVRDIENENEISPYWQVSDWETCSVCCGGGIQRRIVTCAFSEKNGKVYALAEHWCSKLKINRPSEQRACNEEDCRLGQSKF